MNKYALGWLMGLCVAGLSHAATYQATPANAQDRLQQLRQGDTLLLQPGVYRMTLDIRARSGTAEAPITIRGAGPQGSVIIRGSDVLTDWKSLGNDLYEHALEIEPSQVFVNGTLYRQIGGTVFDGYPDNPRSEYLKLHPDDGGVWPGRVAAVPPDKLPPNSFTFDRQARRLYVKSSVRLQAASVEASQRPWGFFAEKVRHLIIEDIDIQHANTSVTRRGGAIVVWGEDVTMRRIRATWNDLAGIQFGGKRVTLEDSEASYNGQTGVTARGSDHTVRGVKANHNNRRLFNKWWEAGGFKFIGDLDSGFVDSKVIGCQALFNAGDGIWFDWKNRNVELRESLAAYNAGFGVHYEASSTGRIEDNIVIGNDQRGIYLSSSDETSVTHNFVLGNGLEGIAAIFTDGRRDHKGVLFKAHSNRIENNLVAWNRRGAVIIPPDTKARSDRNIYLGSGDDLKFSLGFPTLLSPSAKGVEAWQRRSGQDGGSAVIEDAIPEYWSSYLASRSTTREPVERLMRDVAGRFAHGAGPRHIKAR